jgi:hypothetical protein
VATYKPRTFEMLQQVAADCSCKLVVADADELLVDLDTKNGDIETQLGILHARLEFLNTFANASAPPWLQVVRTWTSRGGGRHVVIQSRRSLTRHEQLVLQLALGSDVTRELVLYSSAEEPNALFEPNKEQTS